MSALERLNESIVPLVARARRGDVAAFAEVARSCRSLIYRWSAVATGDPDEAEDITQDVLVRLQGGLRRYRTGSRFTTWLYRIVQNAVADHVRGRRRRLRLVQDSAAELMPPQSGHDPSRPVLRQETGQIVRDFLDALPARQRQVLDLVDLQDRSPAQAAAMLGLDAGTVRAHLHRARRTLRSRIVERCPELVEGTGT
jgi:RNA polymerase sigma-70 factor (ECF subfamily)